MYNRYHGNSGRVERVEEQTRQSTGQTDRVEPQPAAAQPPGREPFAAQRPRHPGHSGAGQITEARPPGVLSGLSGELGQLLRRLSGRSMETEDLLLLLLLILLYRESGDEEFLFAAAGLLLC